jgi:hypothetical protein
MSQSAKTFPTLAVLALAGLTAGCDPMFQDVTAEQELEEILSFAYVHTASWGDVDGDGLLDLFVGTFAGGDAPAEHMLLLNRGGWFEPADQPAISIAARGSGSVLADLDGDGDPDLYISHNTIPTAGETSAEPSRLFRNDGGVFVDVTTGSGIDAQTRNGRQVAVLDFNADGLLDLFVVADALRGSGPSVLLQNLGEFQFRDASADAGIAGDVHGLGLAVGDVTGNGWPDLFVAGGPSKADTNSNYLFLANGDGTYREMEDDALDWSDLTTGNEDWVSGGAFADLDRDGRLDLVVSHHFGTASELGDGAPLGVYLNRGLVDGDPVFEDVTDEVGMPAIDSKSPHVELQDFNNDGWVDIYTSITIETPFGITPLIFTSRGIVGGSLYFHSPPIVEPHYYPGGPVGDFDGDGRLDIFLSEFRAVLGEGPASSRLMRNTSIYQNWIDIRIEDPATPMGIGAKVRIYRSGTEELLGFREIQVGYGFSSSQPAVAHFGLGYEPDVTVVVEMPVTGTEYRLESVRANQLVIITAFQAPVR